MERILEEVIMLKGQNEKLKNKKFYIWMLSGVLVVICICAVGLNITGLNKGKKQELADLNGPSVENNIATKDEVKQTEEPNKGAADNEENEQSAGNAEDELNLLENDIVDGGQQAETEDAKQEEPESVSVMSNKNNVLNGLKFDEESGLDWPAKGNVILDFSPDKTIYFPTLSQYKCNPAIIIGLEEGASVASAAKGVVTKIYDNEETGRTLEMAIGNDYTLTYGQLKDISVKEGDTLSAGQKFASIAKPTKYYVVEGSNLFFKVTQNETPVDPLLLIK